MHLLGYFILFTVGAMDRYTPGEAYAFTTYELKKAKLQQAQQAYLPPAQSKPATQSRPPPPRMYPCTKFISMYISFPLFFNDHFSNLLNLLIQLLPTLTNSHRIRISHRKIYTHFHQIPNRYIPDHLHRSPQHWLIVIRRRHPDHRLLLVLHTLGPSVLTY